MAGRFDGTRGSFLVFCNISIISCTRAGAWRCTKAALHPGSRRQRASLRSCRFDNQPALLQRTWSSFGRGKPRLHAWLRLQPYPSDRGSCEHRLIAVEHTTTYLELFRTASSLETYSLWRCARPTINSDRVKTRRVQRQSAPTSK